MTTTGWVSVIALMMLCSGLLGMRIGMAACEMHFSVGDYAR